MRFFQLALRGRRCRDRMVVEFTTITTDIVSSNLDQGECTSLYDKVCQCLVTGGWFSPGPPLSSTNKTDRHDIADILLKVALNTIKLQTSVCIDIYNNDNTIELRPYTN